MREFNEEDYVFEVVGRSGHVYAVPREVWDLIPSSNKRVVEKETPSAP